MTKEPEELGFHSLPRSNLACLNETTRPPFLAALLLGGLVLVGCDSNGSSSNSSTTDVIVGTWVGDISQNTVSTTLTMTVNPAGEGQAAGTMRYEYQRITCEERLTYNGRDRSTYEFTQTTETSACSTEGRIRVRPQGEDRLSWQFDVPDRQELGTASTTLSRRP